MGAAGVLVFSLSLPVTRLAVQELDPTFVAFARMTLAGTAAAMLLAVRRGPLPTRRQLPGLAAVALGVVIGFPLLSTLAMHETDASHGAVVVAIIPIATAVAATVLTGERPSPRFWLAALAGALLVVGFALWRSHGALASADLYLLVASILCAIGYAVGADIARTMPALNVIAWALVFSLPLAVVLTSIRLPAVDWHAGPVAWLALLYVALMSQFAGFYFWYGGLARGGIAQVGQVQLLQTFLTLVASALILGERLDPVTLVFAAATVGTVWLARQGRVARPA